MTSVALHTSVYERSRLITAQTPFLALDSERMLEAYHATLSSVTGAEVFYAVKCSGESSVLRVLADEGSSFDVASLGELERVLALGVAGSRIVCSNPIKIGPLCARCMETDVFAMVVDSEDEVRKVAQYAPGARIYVRLAVDNSGAVMPLDKKFGVSAEQALQELLLARELGLDPIGLSFHVGSQSVKVGPWVAAIEACGHVWRAAAAFGINLYFLDLGGGYPVQTDPTVPTIEAIGAAITQAVEDFIPPAPDLKVIMEPGRGLVGAAGVLVMTVIGRAQRGSTTWLYLDGGVFHGLTEILEGFTDYEVMAEDDTAPLTHEYTLAGPTCDSSDTILRNVQLPETNIGDRLFVLNAGAYSTEYSTTFNGFDRPSLQLM